MPTENDVQWLYFIRLLYVYISRAPTVDETSTSVT